MLFVKGHLEKYLKFKNIFGAHPQTVTKNCIKWFEMDFKNWEMNRSFSPFSNLENTKYSYNLEVDMKPFLRQKAEKTSIC